MKAQEIIKDLESQLGLEIAKQTEISDSEIKTESLLPIKMLGDRVLIWKIDLEGENIWKGDTDLNIVIPNDSNSMHKAGIVVAVGPGIIQGEQVWSPVSVNVGEVVHYAKDAGSTISIKGTEFRIVRNGDIWMVR